jgi:hypothetical protein
MKSFEKQLAERLTFKPFKAREEKTDYGTTRWVPDSRHPIRAGSVLRLKNGRVQIVGDCNELFGVCDDCVEYGYKDIKEVAHIEQLLEKRKPRRRVE